MKKLIAIIKEYWQSSLFKSYILSYFLIFLVPFIFISYFFYQSSIADLRETIEKTNLDKLKQAEDYTSERMKELEQLTTRITYNGKLAPYVVSHDYYGRNAIDELDSYKESSAIVEGVFLYYDTMDQVYSSSGAHHLETLWQDVYPFSKWSEQTLSTNLQAETPHIETIQKDKDRSHEMNMLVVFHPIPVNNPQPFGTVMYTIKENILTKRMQDVLGDFEGNTYIVNPDNQVVASTESADNIDADILQKIQIKEEGNQRIKYNEQDFSVSSIVSEQNGWKYISLMDARQIDDQLFSRKIIFAGFLLVLLLAGITVAVVLANRQYKPIRSLYEKTRDSDTAYGMEKTNELETIRDSITNIVDSHESLSNSMLMQRPFARGQLLMNLLKGTLQHRKDIDELLQASHISMKVSSFYVAIFYFDAHATSEADLEKREEVIQYLTKKEIPGVKQYAVDLLSNNAVGLIVSTGDVLKYISTAHRELLAELQTYIKEMTLSNTIIGVGQPYQKKQQLNQSYIEALATVDHRFSTQLDAILYFEDLPARKHESIGFLEDQQIKLIYSLKQGDKNVSQNVVQEMFYTIRLQERSGSHTKIVCTDIVNTIVKTASELEVTDKINDLDSLIDFQSLQQLEISICDTVIELCDHIATKTRYKNTQLYRDMKKYIQDHYNTYEMSLESMAQYFQLSVPYVSRFFKEQFGDTFTHYVFTKRMNAVKHALLHTDAYIKDIIYGVGYTDVSNFSREFKKVEGITPGQYRKVNEQN